MRNALWGEQGLAGCQQDILIRDPETELALEHVEHLVLCVMDVQRRRVAGRGKGVLHGVRVGLRGAFSRSAGDGIAFER